MIDMNDFTFFVGAADELIVKDCGQELREGYYFASTDCHNYSHPKELEFRLLQDRREPCSFFQDYTRIKSIEISRDFFPTDRHKILKAVENRIRLVPMSLLESVIHRDLTKAKTAFVSPLHLFESDWNHFQEAMRLDSSISFTRFRDSEKITTLKSYKMYEFAKNLHPMHKHIPRRLKAVFSSGIQELWRKWNNLRQTLQESRNEHRSVAMGDSSYLPLSFRGSDVNEVFALFGICVIASILIRISELAYSCFTIEILVLDIVTN